MTSKLTVDVPPGPPHPAPALASAAGVPVQIVGVHGAVGPHPPDVGGRLLRPLLDPQLVHVLGEPETRQPLLS